MKTKASFELSSFRPPYHLRNPHAQSIYAGIFLKGDIVNYRRERLNTSDEDFFDIDIIDGSGPVVIACHGFEGSSNSTHITRLMTLVQKLGWSGYAINYRSCSGVVNDTFYTYNAGKTEDLEQLIWYVHEQNPSRPIFLAGYSFGANILANCISRPKSKLPRISASALISGNYRIEPGVIAMSKGFSRVYEESFVSSLIEKYKQKQSKFPNEIDYEAFFESKTLYELDEKITAPYFNFSSASNFYEDISSATHLTNINHPTFMLNSIDDPLSPPACFPLGNELSSHFLNFFTTEKGGHVAFVSRDTSYWLEKQILRWFIFNIS
jgi:predicted alpha/beta-fold hydrolase